MEKKHDRSSGKLLKIFIDSGLFISILAILFFVQYRRFFFVHRYTSPKVSIATTPSATSSLAIFFLPHQDDEMFMAGTIASKIEDGKDVYVVMVTDGGASSARSAINGENSKGKKVFSPTEKKYHEPIKEGYWPLNSHSLTRARNKEFHNCMARLGVPPANILFANPGGMNGTDFPIYQDKHLTKESASQIINYYRTLLGDGEYYTVGAETGHVDHLALRDALLSSPNISKKFFFSEETGIGRPFHLTLKQRQLKYNALESYYKWRPDQGRFAVAIHSVNSLLKKWRSSDVEFILSSSEISLSSSGQNLK